MSRRKVSLICLFVIVQAAGAMPASARGPRPTIVEVRSNHYCLVTGGAGSPRCSAASAATEKGDLTGHAFVQSGADASLPTYGDAKGINWLTARVRVNKPTESVPVKLDVQVNHASASWTTPGPWVKRTNWSQAFVLFQFYVRDAPPGCGCLDDGTFAFFARATEPGQVDEMRDRAQSLSFVIESDNGTPLPRGDYIVELRTFAATQMGTGMTSDYEIGTMEAAFDAFVTGLSAG